ncbi:MAG: two-component system response regulator HsbR [Candidatus Pelagadaptatus aseana]|uniref:ATP-binding SpoIIE family protein phosphatase n=1 Tax=Candidatus Pelagadaptatus aseana TaxID=3120508 RepID=UPI0039B2E644
MSESSSLKVLIADDTDTDRMILESIVKREGHQVVSVCNGVEAVNAYEQERPDIVLMDALMPILDGFGAARQIKALAGEELVPIIFLTSLNDTESLVKCLDAGGDDFLSKPYNRVILQAKIKAFSRMREMNITMQEQRDQIALHNSQLLKEQAVAKHVFDNIAHTGCLGASNVNYLLSPLAVFNGDIIVAAMRPSGNMLVLLGDFTGHGLPAAIGAMPLASIFYGMVQKGFSMIDILREINQKLKQILPIGVFCCATIVDMDFSGRQIKVWNGGLPDCYIYRKDSGQVDAVSSTHLPLGVLDDKEFRDDYQTFPMNHGDRFYMWSDGIIESRGPEGGMYGEDRLKAVFEGNQLPAEVFDEVLKDVQAYIGTDERDDDISMIELEMVPADSLEAQEQEFTKHNSTAGLIEWSLDLELKPSTCKIFDPLPLLLNILVEVPGLRRYSGELYTIMAELYSNTLEHGLLQLDSAWKSTAEGFTRYYTEREERLSKLQDGGISFQLSHQTSANGGRLIIVVQDTGQGFSRDENVDLDTQMFEHSGRGIPLVKSLCETLRYSNNGSRVEAVFSWQQ